MRKVALQMHWQRSLDEPGHIMSIETWLVDTMSVIHSQQALVFAPCEVWNDQESVLVVGLGDAVNASCPRSEAEFSDSSS